MASITEAEIRNRMGFHRGTFPEGFDMADIGRLSEFAGQRTEDGSVATAPLHAIMRKAYIALADFVVANTPGGREQSLAITALEESLMRTNQAIALTAPLVDEG